MSVEIVAGAAPGFSLTALDRVSARRVDHDWAWARDNAEAIDRNWERRKAETPGLFDGPVYLANGCSIADGACEAHLFEVRYSRFIAFRDAGVPDALVANAFAAIVPHSGDGAVLLGVMGAHTANAGQIYFPCGTPDSGDLRADGTVDLAGSAAREFLEETGLTLPEGAEEAWVLLRGDGQLAFLRPVRFEADAETLKARIEAHRGHEGEPELAHSVIARSRADIDTARMPGFVQAYLASVFSE
ncbi:NUDIX hydrolase [Methylorubrum populi]|uniref:NUDIX hydrolase n=1 Tax=Methylorubrum rhodesianum TaxID=29427 RepID=A0ABU9ZD92_9HYPH|nr:NUDIX hydrolase [Methylorubrum rhodesianum]MBK3406201.1 NUDIX hydrolase [Methylorubrum rhodesianum]MBY0143305.1 NUDIX hydrolase [Methylorubrum populi]